MPLQPEQSKDLNSQFNDSNNRDSETIQEDRETTSGGEGENEPEEELNYPNAGSMAIIMPAISMAMFLVSLV